MGQTSGRSLGRRDRHHPAVHELYLDVLQVSQLAGLLAKNFPKSDDGRVPLAQAEFLARAWKLANDKARELGWIV